MSQSRYSRDGREDARLVVKCRSGDMGAFEILVRKYQDPLYNIAYRMVGDPDEAKDLAQEAFMRALEGMHTFDARMPFSSWIYRIGTNAAIDHLRRRARASDFSLENASRVGKPSGGMPHGRVGKELATGYLDDPEELSIVGETSRVVREALLELPENYRAVIVLHHLEGMTYTQIGRVLGVPKNTAKTWASRARGMLCECLQGVI